MKKYLFCLFAVLSCTGIFAQQLPRGLLYEIVERSVTITGYTGNAVTLNIPSQIDGLPVTSIGEGAFSECGSLTSVTIPSSVTYIGEDAFAYCRRLTSVTIPSSVTAIGKFTFYNCNSLTSVTIPSSVTYIGEDAFTYCNSLTSVTIPSSVTYIGRDAFTYCNSLTSFTVDNRNPAYASIDGVLFNKNIRTLIYYPAGRNQRTYVIPSSVTTIGNDAFNGCSSLTSVTIPSSVTSIIDRAFYYCINLASVTIPSSVTYIGVSAFGGCDSLTGVTIPSSVTSIERLAFNNCSRLTNITVDNRNPAYASIDGVLFDKNILTLIRYPQGRNQRTYVIPSSVTSIGEDAFHWCISLTGITIPSSVTSIGLQAFDGCSNLTSVTLSRRTQVGDMAFPETTGITYRD